MRFETPATTNPIDQLKVVGRPTDRIDGPLKTTGSAPYAYDRHDVVPNQAYGYVVGSAIAKGRIASINLTAAKAAPGVLAIVTAENAGKLGKGSYNTARLLGGPDIDHYHQAIAVVVAETFEQARAAAQLVRVTYARAEGRYDLAAAKDAAIKPERITGGPPDSAVGDFAGAFAAAPVQLDATYTTPDQAHAMMEPHASVAAWNGDKLTLWTSNQMIDWSVGDMARTLGIPKESVRLVSPFIGGGFGGKLFVRADALLAALGARAAGRPVKVALTRPLMFNNTTHRPATIQRIKIGATRDGKITAIGHESWSGDLPGGKPEATVRSTRVVYAGANRMTASRLAALDLPEGNACAGRRAGVHGNGDRHRRNGRKAPAGPDRIPRSQRHPGRSRAARPALLAAPSRRVPAHRRGSFRLEPAQRGAWQAPRRALAARHRSRRRLPRQSRDEVGCARATRQSRRGHG
jgi:xanthine dehydrogenase YagR molybdenum-binding subunit